MAQNDVGHAAKDAGSPDAVLLPQSGQVLLTGTGDAAGPDPVRPSHSAVKTAVQRRPGGGPPAPVPNPVVTPAGANGRVTQAEVDALEAGLGLALAELEENLVDQVFTETLPLVGDRFAAAFDNNEAAFRYLSTLRTAIVGGLGTLMAGPDYSPSQVQSPINTRLNSAGFTSSSVAVTTVNDQVQLAFTTSDTFNSQVVPIGSDFGLPNLDLDLLSPANASTAMVVTLRFTAGVDGSGFYLETNAPNTLFTINTTTTVSTTLNAPVRFANLPFRLNDDTSPRSSVTANFALTLRDPDNPDNKIRIGELAGTPDLLDATVTGTAALNFTITSDLPAEAALPKVRTDLALSWGYPARPVDPDDDNESFGNAPTLSLNNNSIQVSTFFRGFTRQVLRGIADATSELNPLIEAFTAEIPLLSDLGSDAVTLLDIAGATAAEKEALEALAKLAALSQLATGMTTADTVWTNLGSYAWTGDLRTVTLTDLQGAATAPPANPSGDLATFLADAAEIPGLDFPLLKTPAGAPNGQALVNLLMGRPADLFTYSSGKTTVEDGFSASYPVLGPIFVTLGGVAGVSAQFGFGFDSEGIFEYADAGPGADPALIFKGFYAMSADENGDPFTGISVFGGITAGVEANIGIAAIGAEGDITLEVGLYLNPELGDNGRLRGDMIYSMPFEDLFIAAGSISAGLRVYAEVGVGPFSVGYDWESPRFTIISFDSLDDEVPVLAEPDPSDPARLILNVGDRAPRRRYGIIDDRAEEFTISGGASGIAITAFNEENTFPAPALIIGNPDQQGDVIELEPDVNVPARLHGGGGRDDLSGGAAADELHGDAGLDKLKGRGGNDTLRGGEENDELMGGPGADILDGGPGEDTASWADSLTPITIDLRDGTFTGDAALDTLISIERYKGSGFADVIHGSEGFDGLLNGDAGNDLINGHGGDDYIEGGGGDDTLSGEAGNDLINGGYGADTMNGGEGTDTLSYLSPSPPLPEGVVLDPVTINLQTGLGTRGEAAGDVVSGFEILIGSGVPAGVTSPVASGDDLTGSDYGDTILGMGGTDLIHGGGGNDILHGDTPDATAGSILTLFDADTIYGEAGDDQIFGQSDDDKLYGGDGHDALDGGEGADTLDAGAGNDTLLGGMGDDHLLTIDPAGFDVLDGGPGYNRLSADYSDKTTPLNFTVGPDNAHTFADGDGFSFVQTLGSLTTGSGNDVIRLAASQEPELYSPKYVNGGAGDDLVIADWRGFYPVGQSAVRTNDSLHGGDGNDTISFEQSTGRVSANLGSGGLGGVAAGMTMSGFENVIGSNYIDSLVGDAGPNIFRPLRGGPSDGFPNDNPDSIQGGGGEDTLVLDYSNDERANAAGVSVTPNQTSGFEAFVLGPNWDVGGNRALHIYTSIEHFHITGSDMADRFYPDAGAYSDIFHGRGGNDLLRGGGGDDLITGGDGNDTIETGGGNDTASGGTGNDDITFLRHTTAFNEGWLGIDTLDAGPGDDVVSNLWAAPGSGPPGANAEAGTIFRADGGSGYDTLSADFSRQSQPIIYDQNHPADIEFPNGSYIRGFEFWKDFVAGSGNDVITFRGRENSRIQMHGGNDVINPGLGVDMAWGGPGDDLLVMDYSAGDDANVSGIQSTASNVHTRTDVNTGAVLDRVTVAEIERSHVTGSSKADSIQGQNGADTLFGCGGNDTLTGNNGNDFLDGGPGADQMLGEAGNDYYVVDDAGDIVRETNTSNVDLGGLDTVRSSVSFTLPTGPEILILTGSALNATGNSYSNTITGNAQNNQLQGLNGNDTLNGGGGPNEVDRLNGGAGADTFVLGEAALRYYDDGDPLSPGLNGYAVIEDFTPAQSDRLRLTGGAAQYFLGVSPVAGVSGTALYHDSNGSGVLENATDELIAIINGPVALTPANTLTPGSYPTPVTPESIGLTDAPRAVFTDSGGGPGLAMQFTINEPLPAGVLIEIQASSDLGMNDTWQTIASKNGTAAWTGLVPATVSAPDNGRVTVTIGDMVVISGNARRFLQMRLTSP